MDFELFCNQKEIYSKMFFKVNKPPGNPMLISI